MTMRNLVTVALLTFMAAVQAQPDVTLMHVHGLAYSVDGKRLMIPSHHGLAVYENGKWSKAPGPQHDYMGFSATAKHLYSSGHPAPGSGLVNPFGLIRSRDGGKTWEPEQLLSRFPQNLPGDLHARPRLLSDGKDKLWTVWVGVRSRRSSVYMNRSSDGGKTWTEPLELTGESRSVFGHSLHRDGDRLLLVWHDTRTGRDRMYSATSADDGNTWTAPLRIDHLPDEQTVWMSHRDSVTAPPDGARVVAESPTTPVAAFEDAARSLYGVQFHPEVVHTPHGQELLKNFLYEVAGAPPAWTPAAFSAALKFAMSRWISAWPVYWIGPTQTATGAPAAEAVVGAPSARSSSA